jgi:hypothetical protein
MEKRVGVLHPTPDRIARCLQIVICNGIAEISRVFCLFLKECCLSLLGVEAPHPTKSLARSPIAEPDSFLEPVYARSIRSEHRSHLLLRMMHSTMMVGAARPQENYFQNATHVVTLAANPLTKSGNSEESNNSKIYID